MRRRTALAILGAALSVPAASIAQTRNQKRLGILLYTSPEGDLNLRSFLILLREFGFVQGDNVALDYRYAEGRPERLPELALELANSKPDALFALEGDVVAPAARATKLVPIVFVSSADPVQLGVAASLARPGGNATGVTLLLDDLASKRMQLLKEASPGVTRVAFVSNPEHPDNELREAERAALGLDIELRPTPVRTPNDFAAALRAAEEARVHAMYVVSSRQTVQNITKLVDFARVKSIPLVGGWGAWAQAGALLSYGPNLTEMLRRAADYVARVLEGANPADLPIQQPARFDLTINLKTANALGLTIPPTLLARADEVIE